MIGRFCGSTIPNNFISTTNNLYLWFRSDNSSSHDGFELTWNSITPVCGGLTQIRLFGTISSPGSPGNYPPNRYIIIHVRSLGILKDLFTQGLSMESKRSGRQTNSNAFLHHATGSSRNMSV